MHNDDDAFAFDEFDELFDPWTQDEGEFNSLMASIGVVA